MAARGYVQSRARVPDLLIHYHASINQRIDVYGVDREHGYCDGDDCQSTRTDGYCDQSSESKHCRYLGPSYCESPAKTRG